MSLLPQQTNANTQLTYFVKATGQQLFVSSLVTNSISTATLNVSSLVGEYVSTVNVDSEYVNTSTINALHVDLDGQILTATPTDLLLNGVPVATTANLSSLSDWSLDPAISTVQMLGNDINAAGTISSINVRSGNGFFGNLVAFNALFVSTQTSTISSLVTTADLGLYSTLLTSNLVTAPAIETSSLTTSTVLGEYASLSSLVNVSSLNGQPISFYEPGAVSTVSTFSDLYTSSFVCSTLASLNWISTPLIYVSSINGAEFTSTGITVEVAGVSSLVANSISSVGAELRQALVSTIQFKPTFDINFNFDLTPVGEGIKAGLTRIAVAVAGGLTAVATGLIASATSRNNTTNINNNYYEQYCLPTQLQFSTLGDVVSSYTRFVSSSSGDGNTVPGTEIFVSTIIPAGTLALRSLGDPINLPDPSTVTSTIQSFGQWVPVPPELTTSTFSTLAVKDLTTQTLSTSLINSAAASLITIASPLLYLSTGTVGGVVLCDNEVDALRFESRDVWTSTVQTSSITASTIVMPLTPGAELTVGKINTSFISSIGLNFEIQTTGNMGFAAADMNLIASTVRIGNNVGSQSILYASTFSTQQAVANTVVANAATLSSLTLQQTGVYTRSTVMSVGPAPIFGLGTSSCVTFNTDLSVGQNDLYAQQLRIGYNSLSSITPEIVLYAPDTTFTAINRAGGDRTLRIANNTGTDLNPGYLLDTKYNAPFFSTINSGTSTALFAFYPSTNVSTFGASTLSVIPNPIFVAATGSLSSQRVLAANTPLALDLGSASVNIGGFTLAASTLTVPVAGTYQLSPSIQFNTTSGGANQVDFWLTKNGVDVENSASRISVANNAEQIGTVILYDTAAAGTQYGIKIASADANMEAGFFQSTVTTPYTRPAIPSIILNAQRIA